MTVIASARAGPELAQRWRRQIARQRRRRVARGSRPLAAVGYLVNGPTENRFVDIRRILFVVVHDQSRAAQRLAIRVAAYAASPVRWGVQVGGAMHIRLEKNLALAPDVEGRGQRFQATPSAMLSLALDLDHFVERHDRHPALPRRHQPRWPRLWAAFQPAEASQVRAEGPEWQTWQRTWEGPRRNGNAPRRTVAGLAAFPLDFVSHAWPQVVAIYADLTTIPKRQVICADRPQGLQGFCGAMEYDLIGSRFSGGQPAHRR